MAELVVRPGYQRMKRAQREMLLDLYEAGSLSSPVDVFGPVRSGCFDVTDTDGRRWYLKPNGSAMRMPDRRSSLNGPTPGG